MIDEGLLVQTLIEAKGQNKISNTEFVLLRMVSNKEPYVYWRAEAGNPSPFNYLGESSGEISSADTETAQQAVADLIQKLKE
jgi:hypothetical protein